MSSSHSVEESGKVPFIPHPEKEAKKHPLGEGETLRTNIDRTVSELLTCVESFRREPSMSEKKEILEKKIRPMVSTLRTITAPTSEEKQESGAPEKAAEETKKTIQETIKAVEKAVTDEIETHFSATETTDRTDHEKMITFMRSAHGWLAELHDDRRIPLALRMAAFYVKQNDIEAAIKELEKLVPQFTEDLKREFQKLKESPTQTGLLLFQDHLQRATPQATPSLSEEALRQTPVMENILAHLKDPRQLMQVSKTLKAAVQADLTEEQVEAYAKNILSAKGAGFSLVTAPQICRQNRVIALNAMLKNGLEYQYLSEELKNDIGLVKIAYLSVLKNSPEKIPENSKADF